MNLKITSMNTKITSTGLAIGLLICTTTVSCSSERGYSLQTDTVKNIHLVHISAKTSGIKEPISVELPAGTYTVEVIGKNDGGIYEAWKPWFYKSKQNKQGKWEKGWVNKYSINADEIEEITIDNGIIYGTPEEALKNASGCEFTIKQKSLVKFYIKDSPMFDNSGGISLRVSQ
jgi:hypothetical protein